MPRKWVWTGLLAAAVAYEAWALRTSNDSTLSATTRRLFRTETQLGRIVFGATLIGVGSWFLHHVIQQPTSTLAAELTTSTTRAATVDKS